LPRLWALATMSVICIEDDKSRIWVNDHSKNRMVLFLMTPFDRS